MGWQTLHKIQMFSILQDVNSWLCQAIGAGCCATNWVSRVTSNNHCLLSTYGGPEAVLFHLCPLNLSLHQSDEIATYDYHSQFTDEKTKAQKVSATQSHPASGGDTQPRSVWPQESPHLPTGPCCFPRHYSLGMDSRTSKSTGALALALSPCVTSCVTLPWPWSPVSVEWGCDQPFLLLRHPRAEGSGERMFRTFLPLVELDLQCVFFPWS